MRKFYESTTAQFALLVLLVAGLAAGFHLDPNFGWAQWADLGKWAVGIYATKEGVRYGAEAVKN